MAYLSCEDIERIAEKVGVSTEEVDLLALKERFYSTFNRLIREERDKLPYGGRVHNSGNMRNFVSFLVKKLGRKNVVTTNFGSYISVMVLHDLHLKVEDDGVSLDYEWDKLAIGLHSKFYDVVYDFLFDEKGAFRLYRNQYDAISVSISHLLDVRDKMRCADSLLLALGDAKKYQKVKDEYELMYAELKPFAKYEECLEWDDALMRYGVETAKRTIADIEKKSVGKSLEACRRKMKLYVKSRDALLGAFERKLIGEEDCPKPWDDFIGTIAVDNSEDKLKRAYQNRVALAFEEKIKECECRNTRYMLNKKKMMETDLALCKQMKEVFGLDCFIDRSMFCSTVSHMNVVLADNNVLMFRMGKKSPEWSVCERYADVMQSLVRITDVTGKTLKLCKCYSRSGSKLSSDDKSELGVALYEMLKFVKGGELEFTTQNAKLSVPLDNHDMGIEISISKKTALVDFAKIADTLKSLLKTVKKIDGFEIKGICKERMPHL